MAMPAAHGEPRQAYLRSLKASSACRLCLGDPASDADLELPNAPLYAAQASLPALPVPPLRETCDAYLRSVEALATPAELEHSRAAVEAFCAEGGVGEELQRRLRRRAEKTPKSSWLAAWWNHAGYLACRDPLPIHASYFLHFTRAATQQIQAQRAAMLVHHACAFRERWKVGDVPQERVGRKATPLCSAAYKYLFNSCRLPARGADVYALYDPHEHDHIVVFCGNAPYVVRVINPHSNELLTPDELEHHFDTILRRAGVEGAGNAASARGIARDSALAVGVMTGWDRDAWAEGRARLLALPGNASVLAAIESAALVLCLDDSSPQTPSKVAQELLHGDGRNRWFDKPLQFIVFRNGEAGLLAEHAMMDGMPVSRMVSEVLRDADSTALPPVSGLVVGTVLPLCFRLDHGVARSVETAARNFNAFVGDYGLATRTFSGFGSAAIKRWRMSPDAFVQMAMQVAYRRMTGHHAPTYEATQTRRFRHGRTETTRSCSVGAVALVAAVEAGAPLPVQRKRLEAATKAHAGSARRASEARGVDRHLFGLRQMVRSDEGEAALFRDPMFSRTKTWEMSTSTVVDERYAGWGFGPVVPRGVGLAYMVKTHGIHFNITARRDKPDGNPELLCQHLEAVLLHLREVCEKGAEASREESSMRSKL